MERVVTDSRTSRSLPWLPVQPRLYKKHQAANAAYRAVDRAIDVAGGFGVSRGGPLERLFRDSRMGRLHPVNFALTHELIAKIHLGIDLDMLPRWG